MLIEEDILWAGAHLVKALAQPRGYVQEWQLRLTFEKNQAVCSGTPGEIRVGSAEEAELRKEVCGIGVPL